MKDEEMPKVGFEPKGNQFGLRNYEVGETPVDPRPGDDEPPNALREPLKVIHGALTEAIVKKDKELFDRMNNQIQTAITLRDRAAQVALNFVGHSISSSDGSYELLIQVIYDSLIAQAHISAKAERDECVKILQKTYQQWFDGDHGPGEAFSLAIDNIRARSNPTFKGVEIIFDED